MVARTCSSAAFACLVFFATVCSLAAQTADSILVGVVTDSTGAPIAGAAVSAANVQTGVNYSSVTGTSGEYRLNNVPIGQYDVTAKASGFAASTVKNVDLQLNHTATANLTLDVSTVSTTVEVTEAGAGVDTSTAQLQTTFDSRSAIDLPVAGNSKVVNGAGIYNLSLLGAGVATSGGIGQGSGPSVAGQRPENNSFTLDGVMNDNHYTTGPQVYVSNEAVAELTLVQNQFGAEFGGASGGIFNAVVKSGTNTLHGSIYEYMQNRKLNAVDATETQQGLTSNPRFDDNRLGATIGGPILKDRLFYFGNFEYNPLGQAAQPGQTVYAPTSEGYTMLNNIAGLSQTNLKVFQQYVPPASTATGSVSVLGNSIPIGPLSFASPDYYNNYSAVAAIDWDISSRDQVRGRYFYDKSLGLDFLANLPAFFLPAPDTYNLGSISEFHNFSPTLENELRISFSRSNLSTSAGDFKFPGLSVFPNLSFDELNGLQIGPDPNAPSGDIENLFQVQESLTKTYGRHTIKAGYSLVDVILTGFFVQRSRGDYDYATLQTYLLDQQPDGGTTSGVTGERSVGNSAVPFGHLEHAAFVNDDFRIRPNLTINLGLRYEYVTVPVGSRAQQYSAIANIPGVITFGEPQPTANDWSPRLGFAYSPGSRGVWSIRGGISRAFDNTYVNLNQNASPAFYQTTVDVDPEHPVSNFLANGGLSAALPTGAVTVAQARAAIAAYTFNQIRPYAMTGTLGVQRQFAKDYVFEARYVHTKGVHLWNQTRMNMIAPVTPANGLPTYLTMPSASQLAGLTTTLGQLENLPFNLYAPYGINANVITYHPWGNSLYDGLALQVTKRFSKDFSGIAAYTWSHNFDDSTATNNSTILSPRRAQDFQNMREEWASSALDRRQRLTLTWVYDFRPFRSGNNFLLKNVVGNWTASGTYTYQSPEFVTIQSGVDSNLNRDPAGDRAIVNPSGVWNVGSGVTAYNAQGQAVAAGDLSTVAYVATNPNARYIQAGLGAYPNGGRNTFPLAPTNNVDASLMKRLTFKERFSFEIGAQAFNLFNHAQFVGGFLSDVNPFFTAGTSRNFLIPGNQFFGQYDQFFPSNARTMQLVGRIVF